MVFPAAAAAFYVVVRALTGAGLINDYWRLILDQSLIIAVASLGLSLIYGFCGQFSLGHAAFYGLGAYTAGLIGKLYGHGNLAWFAASLVAGALVAGFVALLVGLPILRLRSDYLGIATLGFGIIVKVLMDNSNKLIPATGGATGMTGTPRVADFTWIFITTVLVILLVRNFVYSRYGRAWVAIREDEVAADAMGANTTLYKTLAFVLGCGLAGLAGGLYAHRYPFVHPSSFDFLKSIDFLIVVVLGGLGSFTGTVATAIGWVFLLEGLRGVLGQAFVDWRGVVYALILVVTIILRPRGLLGGREWSALVPRVLAVPVGKGERRGGTGS
ncbi:MAG: branched-chain amino acid ABC transporter permease [Bacillota bacterium]|nr:branched-chain amino acid ABC transporter permease [Bacillota bacterium]